MIFTPLPLEGAFLIAPEPRHDARGFFARTWCQREFEERGLTHRLVQCSLSFNKRKGTLRGMHYQASPRAESKLVRCTRGSIFDVIIDLRPGSATFKVHAAVVLTEDDHQMLYVPEGFAHGFQTLAENTEVFYQMSEFHTPELSRGVRWNDPAFGIQWPPGERVMSERDRVYPDFAD